MRKPSLTPKHIQFIKANRILMSSGAMAMKIGCVKDTVQRYLRKNNLSVPFEVRERFRLQGMVGRTTSDPRTDRILKKYYLTEPKLGLSKKVGRSETFVVTRLRQLGLVIPKEIIEQRKADSRIKKGNIPVNKGKKMRPEVYARCAGTMFKKGQISKNKLPLGSMRVSKDGYLEIKITEPK